MNEIDDGRPNGYHLDMIGAGMLFALLSGSTPSDLPAVQQASEVLTDRGYSDRDIAEKLLDRVKRKLES